MTKLTDFMDTLADRDPSACWEWPWAKSGGYGIAVIARKNTPVHRYVYTALVGAIPEGLELDHLCRNRACANPAHLDPVTHAQNMRRVPGACQDPEHERRPSGKGTICVPCTNARRRRAWAKRSAESRSR